MSGAARCQVCGFTYHLADGCRYCDPAPMRPAPAPRPEIKPEIQRDLELIFSPAGQMKLFEEEKTNG